MRQNIPEYSVSEISNSIKNTVEDNFSYVRVRGEISGYKLAPSGHAYLNLKDDSSILAAVSWRGTVTNLKFRPEDGMEVIATGRVTTYPGQSKYQLVIESLEISGVGALMALLEKRKQQLLNEGLFDPSRKKPIPKMPKTIGVITSPTGAVIKDIIHRIEDRFPLKILLWGVLVQGDKAAAQIAEAIEGFNKMADKVDVIIVARGGGSIEDLWPFNEEIVVRATANSTIPIISAVGHETDTTLIDLASDKRAPTPSAAAEMAVPVRSELISYIMDLGKRLYVQENKLIDDKTKYLTNLFKAIPNPTRIIEQWQQRYDLVELRLQRALPSIIERKALLLNNLILRLKSPSQAIENFDTILNGLSKNLNLFIKKLLTEKSTLLELNSKILESYSYQRTIDRGFSIIRDSDGKLISSSNLLKLGDAVSIELKDGTKKARIE